MLERRAPSGHVHWSPLPFSRNTLAVAGNPDCHPASYPAALIPYPLCSSFFLPVFPSYFLSSLPSVHNLFLSSPLSFLLSHSHSLSPSLPHSLTPSLLSRAMYMYCSLPSPMRGSTFTTAIVGAAAASTASSPRMGRAHRAHMCSDEQGRRCRVRRRGPAATRGGTGGT